MDRHTFAVGRRDAGALLTAVLEGEKPEESQAAGLSFRGVYSYYPTLFVGVVERDATEGAFLVAAHDVILCTPFCAGQHEDTPFNRLSVSYVSSAAILAEKVVLKLCRAAQGFGRRGSTE
tara:strand:- start:251 stop:610 length:360 start_codon:yes stop_codon:yes gene_type:complete